MLSRELNAAVGFVERYLFLIRRYIGWELVFFTYQIVNAMTIALIGVSSPRPDAILYLTVGALVWGFISIVFTEVGNLIAWEMWEGTMEFTLMAPVRRATHLLSTSLGAIIYGCVRTLLVLLAVSTFLNLDLSRANVLGTLLILLVSSLAFVGMGLLAAVLSLLSPERGTQAAHILLALILLVSGVYYDISILPTWLQPFSWWSPATYTLEGLRMSILEGAPLSALLPDLLRLGLMGAALIPLGLWVFSRGEEYARRTGKLSRSG